MRIVTDGFSTRTLLALALAAAPAAGCGDDGGDGTTGGTMMPGTTTPPVKATANLESKSGSMVTGTATFEKKGTEVTLTLEVRGATAGLHAAHIHAVGDCSSADGMSAGGHWNPTTADHGKWGGAAHHLGDLGNLTVAADGTAKMTLATDKWSIGTGSANDVVGKSVVVHAMPDDFMTQPTGNAGGRQACGVIVKP
jgi:Cu-Zn family superoxide dismutase